MSERDALQRAILVGDDLQRMGRVLVVGDGPLASEVASTAQAMGCNVTMLAAENAPIPTLHRGTGVDVMTHAVVKAINASGESLVVTLADGWQCQADTVVVCLGGAESPSPCVTSTSTRIPRPPEADWA